jgi:cytidyltransferase-like protein
MTTGRVSDLLQSLGREYPFACAYVGGTFDTIHRGHLALLAETKKIARRTVVSLNTDEFAERYKRRPLLPLADRLAVVANLQMVDAVVVNHGDEDSTLAILGSGADVIVHGTDWPRETLLPQMGLSEAWLFDHSVRLVLLHTPVTSTTAILDAYNQRAQVAAALQRCGLGPLERKP